MCSKFDVNACNVGCVSATSPKCQKHAYLMEIGLIASVSIRGNMFIVVKCNTYIWYVPTLDAISTNSISFDPHLHLAHIQNYSFVMAEWITLGFYIILSMLC